MKITIIGCGTMGSGLAEQLAPFHGISLYDRHEKKGEELAKKINGTFCHHLTEAVSEAQILFLAIKPQNLNEITHSLSQLLKSDQVVISLLAGTPLAILKKELSTPHVVRMMPNLALRYGEGVIGMVDDPSLSKELKESLSDLLKPLGYVYWIKESQIDALTSLTGSGPAFVFILIEAMIEAGVSMGFQAKEAQHLILHMLQGCTTLLEKTGRHPAELKWQIASPKGTTIAGIREMEKNNVRSGIIETFLATFQRAKEMANAS